MVFAVEAWSLPTSDDEEPCEEEMIESREFESEGDAMRWAFARMEEGYSTRLWRR